MALFDDPILANSALDRYDGLVIYTKGKIANFEGREVFYVLISSKRSTDD